MNKDTAIFEPKNQADWRDWLEENHVTQDSVWVIFHKKNSPNPNLDWGEAVDESLCFGWIDSTKKSIDAHRFQQYFCKRKPTSTWSKVNKDKVEELIAAGKMTQAGLQSIEIAKQNGSWTILDSAEALELPPEMEQEFEQHPKAGAFFGSLSKSARKVMLMWIAMAKRPATKLQRIAEIVECAKEGKKPDRFNV